MPREMIFSFHEASKQVDPSFLPWDSYFSAFWLPLQKKLYKKYTLSIVIDTM